MTHHNLNRLLIYGREQTLLDTRRIILQMAGIVVQLTSRMEEVEMQLAGDVSFSQLFVCHTASPADQRALAVLAGRASLPVYQIKTLITPEELIAQAATGSR